jgi:dolichol-phosphate mannosyltransferase
MLSVVIPAYNEEKMVPVAAERISRILRDAGIAFELLFVDDGSRDSTWAAVCAARETLPEVRGVSFSRNFGKEAAIFAGLAEARGDCCAVLDCDLQHPPEKLPEMYALWTQGYEVVEGIKTSRGRESALHRFSARCFYGLISRASRIDMQNASDYKLLDRRAVEVLLQMHEKHAFFRAMSGWIGFKSCTLPYEVQERTIGTSKWSTRSLIRYALSNITSFSTAPMQIVTVLGFIMLVVALVFGIIALCQKIAGVALGGFTTMILLLLFIGSLIMISLGIIGFYIARIYEEVQDRPRYIIRTRCGGGSNR